MTDDHLTTLANLAMKAANERTHQRIEIGRLQTRVMELEAALRDLRTGAEQQSQSHVDVIAAIDAVLGREDAGE